MCEDARQQALEVLLMRAHEMGANAVIAFRYDASVLHDSATEVLCYGAAVVIEPVAAGPPGGAGH